MLNPLTQLSINQLSMMLFAGVMSIGIVIRRLYNPASIQRSGVVAALLILLAMGIGYWLYPAYVGTIGVGVWLLLILLPSLLIYRFNRLVIARNEAKAAQIFKVLRWLQPFDDLSYYDDFLQLQIAAQRQELTDLDARIDRFKQPQTPMQRYLKVNLLNLAQRWPDIITLVQAAMKESSFGNNVHDIVIAGSYVRALSEVGDLETMINAYQQLQPLLAKSQYVLDLAHLVIFAFCGRDQEVEMVLGQRTMQTFPRDTGDYWRAIARWAKPDRANALAEMQRLSTVPDGRIAALAKKRLLLWEASPASVPNEVDRLSADTQSRLEQIVRQYHQALEVGIGGRYAGKRPYVTYALIAINVLVFLVEEYMGGSQDLRNLYELGALVPQAVTYDGEWWRIFTANFLHLGAMHLIMNMLGLAVLGPFVEFRARWLRFLLIYLVSGVGSLLLFTWYQSWRYPDQVTVLVGASGCIMGIVGANLGILLRTWRADRSQYARRALLRILLIIVLQAGIDLLVPVFGFLVHLSGALIGFVTTFLLYQRSGVQETPNLTK